jgi:hypothetical protein
MESEYRIGAITRNGKYCLPCISYSTYDCICFDCKQPVEFIPYGNAEYGDCHIRHRNQSTCLLFESPSETQIIHDALYKLKHFFDVKTIRYLSHSCNFWTWHEDSCDDFVRVSLDLNTDDSYTLDFIHNCLRISDKYTIYVIYNHQNRPDYAEPNTFYIHVNAVHISMPEYFESLNIDDRLYILECGALCTTCSKIVPNLPRIADIPTFNDQPKRLYPSCLYDECPPCVSCGKDDYIPTFYNNGYRRMCRTCIANLSS